MEMGEMKVFFTGFRVEDVELLSFPRAPMPC